MLHTRTEKDLRIFREHEIYSGDICQTSGERNEDEMNTVQLCQYSIQGLVSRYLPNNICHFGSPTFLWRGTQLKLLFQAFLTAISMAYIFTAQKIHWECHFVPHLFWRDGIFLWNYFPRSFTVGAFTARSLTASTISHDENADPWWPMTEVLWLKTN